VVLNFHSSQRNIQIPEQPGFRAEIARFPVGLESILILNYVDSQDYQQDRPELPDKIPEAGISEEIIDKGNHPHHDYGPSDQAFRVAFQLIARRLFLFTFLEPPVGDHADTDYDQDQGPPGPQGVSEIEINHAQVIADHQGPDDYENQAPEYSR
jgi:hypothetical protein